MKLYYAPGACSLADHIALAETGLAYDLAKVDLKAKRVEGEGDYAAINPKGYVPALALDDGTILTENIAVLTYIAERSGDLMPASGIAHLRVLEMLAFVSTELHKNYKPFFAADASEADKQAAAEQLGKRYAYLEGVLGDREFILGDAVTVADFYLFVMLMWARKNALDLPAKLGAYFERLKVRRSVQQALSDEGLS